MTVNDQDPYSVEAMDSDPEETSEWAESLDALVADKGHQRAREIMLSLLKRSKELHLGVPMVPTTDYLNTIAPENEPDFPGDEEIERRYRAWIRWNAAMLVHRAQRPGIAVGGHISTYASSAALYEVGFNHFFRGQDHPGGGDQIFIQGHASPGTYARAFLEGRLSADQLDGFRQEKSHAPNGLSSYPHPRLMPEFWQFPTVSMGLGPINAIYQAQANRYLTNRGIKDASDQHVWAFLGDGEMDEVESRGQLQVAANEGLDNLTFVINCNLQRLDGPVRGNGKIIQELESFFRGAGWNVIKVVWGREWDDLLARDHDGALRNLMNVTPDGDYQTYKAESGAYVRENFFGRDPRALELVKDLSDEQIWNLKRGGHDYRKVYAAFKAATEHTGQPTVILAKTIKGYGLGPSFEGRNATHQMKKMTLDNLKTFRDAMRIPITDAQLEENPYLPPYYHPGNDDEAIQYLHERRRELGGYLPERRTKHTAITLPDDSAYAIAKKGSGTQEIATTMAFVRILKDLMRAKDFGNRIVPIIPDEARTFGMDAFFPNAKIYNPNGQHYTSVDRELLLAYKESPQGQIVHVGINEAGALAAFTAIGTSYATEGEPLIPIYVFYSMFGFQRTGDAIWAAGDQMARGFMIGATAGPHHAHRRGPPARRRPLAAARVDEPGRGVVRPRLRLRDRAHRALGPRPHVRREPPRPQRHVLPHGLQRADRAARRARGRRRRGHRARHPPPVGVDGAGPEGAAPRLRRVRAVDHRGAGAARQRLGRVGGCLVGHELDRAAPRRPRRRRAQLPQPRCRAPYRVRHAEAVGRAAGRSSRSPTSCTRCPTRSARTCPATTPRSAPTGSASPTRDRPHGGSSRSTVRRSWCARSSCSPTAARSTARSPPRRSRSTGCTT